MEYGQGHEYEEEFILKMFRCRSLESGLELVARTYEIDKFRLQVVELKHFLLKYFHKILYFSFRWLNLGK